MDHAPSLSADDEVEGLFQPGFAPYVQPIRNLLRQEHPLSEKRIAPFRSEQDQLRELHTLQLADMAHGALDRHIDASAGELPEYDAHATREQVQRLVGLRGATITYDYFYEMYSALGRSLEGGRFAAGEEIRAAFLDLREACAAARTWPRYRKQIRARVAEATEIIGAVREELDHLIWLEDPAFTPHLPPGRPEAEIGGLLREAFHARFDMLTVALNRTHGELAQHPPFEPFLGFLGFLEEHRARWVRQEQKVVMSLLYGAKASA